CSTAAHPCVALPSRPTAVPAPHAVPLRSAGAARRAAGDRRRRSGRSPAAPRPSYPRGSAAPGRGRRRGSWPPHYAPRRAVRGTWPALPWPRPGSALHAPDRLDPLLPLVEDLLELGKYELPEQPEDHYERDERPDDVVQRRDERVWALLQRKGLPLLRQDCDDVVHGSSLRVGWSSIRTGSRRRYR